MHGLDLKPLIARLETMFHMGDIFVIPLFVARSTVALLPHPTHSQVPEREGAELGSFWGHNVHLSSVVSSVTKNSQVLVNVQVL